MDTCTKCGMPLEQEGEVCSCKESLCCHCCECGEGCGCACGEK